MKNYIQNPFFNIEERTIDSKELSIRSIALKCLFLTILSLVVAIWTWSVIVTKSKSGQLSGSFEAWIIFLSPFLTIILSTISIKKLKLHPAIAVFFALSVGVFYGSFSAVFDRIGSGLILNAAASTFITIISCLILSVLTNGKISNYFIVFLQFIISLSLLIIGYNAIMGILFLDWQSMLEPSTVTSFVLALVGAILGAGVTIIELSIIKEIKDQSKGKEQEWYFATGLLFNMVWIYMCCVFMLAWAKKK